MSAFYFRDEITSKTGTKPNFSYKSSHSQLKLYFRSAFPFDVYIPLNSTLLLYNQYICT